LGVMCLGALIWLALEFGLRVLNLRKVPQRLPSHAPLCGWVVLYSAIGGINCILGLLFGLMYFRSSNRYSIFISAIVLFFLVSRMSRFVRGWSRLTSYALSATVAGIGLLDQIPVFPKADLQACADAVANDQRFCRELEAALPPNAMVFQLPLMNFIDGDPIRDMLSYEHIRPYLWTRQLRFSFGSVQGRTREDWQAQVADLPPDQLAKELERFGFSGLYLNRKAYADRAEKTLKALAKSGRSRLIEDAAGEQVCVALHPSPNPAWPHSDDAAQIVYKSGWVWEEPAPDGNRHWAGNRASLYFVNESQQDCSFHLTGVVTGWTDQRVEVQFQGQSLGSRPLKGGNGCRMDLRLRARPGRNYLHFLSDCQPQPPPGHPQAIRVTFAVVNTRIVRESDR
jgi:hypothetical protein